MSLIVSHKIRQKEFGAKISADELDALKRSTRVALATPIAGKGLPAGTRLLKAHATTSQGPRRIVYLLAVEDGSLFLLFYRDKADDVGANITPKNPAFVAQLKKHLSLLASDIETGSCDEIALG